MSNHDLYEQALKSGMPTLGIGTAGTGKTYMAVRAAYQALKGKQVGKIVVVRPNVSFADTNGFLPGTEADKLAPWVRPVLDNLKQIGVSAGEIETLIKNGKLEISALEHIQGLTFDNSFIIVDECQNMTIKQLEVLLTRQGKYSKLVLCGDVRQISPKFRGSGLQQLIDMVDTLDIPVNIIEFTREDIKRSKECAVWVKAFEDWEEKL
jgi:phosphate starvation-inducible PhoH-like protein